MTKETKQKILCFEIEGEKARFRIEKGTSTHKIIPRTTISGIIAGMMGLPSYNYPQKGEIPFEERFYSDCCNIAVEPLSEVEEFSDHCYACIKTKSGEPVKYVIYFQHNDDEVMNKLKERLISNNFVFQPSMGLRALKATIRYLGEFDIEQETSDTFVKLSSVVRKDNFLRMDTDKKSEINVTHDMPRDFDQNKNALSVASYFYGDFSMSLKDGTYYRVNGKNIVFM